MSALIAGIAFLLFTLWEIRIGEADLLSWLGQCGLDVTRLQNGCFFWLAIVLQLVVAFGFITFGVLSINW